MKKKGNNYSAGRRRRTLTVEAVDMRLGIDGLSSRVQASLGRTPCDGTAYAFTNRRHSRLKLLVWDGTGVWLVAAGVKVA